MSDPGPAATPLPVSTRLASDTHFPPPLGATVEWHWNETIRALFAQETIAQLYLEEEAGEEEDKQDLETGPFCPLISILKFVYTCPHGDLARQSSVWAQIQSAWTRVESESKIHFLQLAHQDFPQLSSASLSILFRVFCLLVLEIPSWNPGDFAWFRETVWPWMSLSNRQVREAGQLVDRVLHLPDPERRLTWLRFLHLATPGLPSSLSRGETRLPSMPEQTLETLHRLYTHVLNTKSVVQVESIVMDPEDRWKDTLYSKNASRGKGLDVTWSLDYKSGSSRREGLSYSRSTSLSASLMDSFSIRLTCQDQVYTVTQTTIREARVSERDFWICMVVKMIRPCMSIHLPNQQWKLFWFVNLSLSLSTKDDSGSFRSACDSCHPILMETGSFPWNRVAPTLYQYAGSLPNDSSPDTDSKSMTRVMEQRSSRRHVESILSHLHSQGGEKPPATVRPTLFLRIPRSYVSEWCTCPDVVISSNLSFATVRVEEGAPTTSGLNLYLTCLSREHLHAVRISCPVEPRTMLQCGDSKMSQARFLHFFQVLQCVAAEAHIRSSVNRSSFSRRPLWGVPFSRPSYWMVKRSELFPSDKNQHGMSSGLLSALPHYLEPDFLQKLSPAILLTWNAIRGKITDHPTRSSIRITRIHVGSPPPDALDDSILRQVSLQPDTICLAPVVPMESAPLSSSSKRKKRKKAHGSNRDQMVEDWVDYERTHSGRTSTSFSSSSSLALLVKPSKALPDPLCVKFEIHILGECHLRCGCEKRIFLVSHTLRNLKITCLEGLHSFPFKSNWLDLIRDLDRDTKHRLHGQYMEQLILNERIPVDGSALSDTKGLSFSPSIRSTDRTCMERMRQELGTLASGPEPIWRVDEWMDLFTLRTLAETPNRVNILGHLLQMVARQNQRTKKRRIRSSSPTRNVLRVTQDSCKQLFATEVNSWTGVARDLMGGSLDLLQALVVPSKKKTPVKVKKRASKDSTQKSKSLDSVETETKTEKRSPGSIKKPKTKRLKSPKALEMEPTEPPSPPRPSRVIRRPIIKLVAKVPTRPDPVKPEALAPSELPEPKPPTLPVSASPPPLPKPILKRLVTASSPVPIQPHLSPTVQKSKPVRKRSRNNKSTRCKAFMRSFWEAHSSEYEMFWEATSEMRASCPDKVCDFTWNNLCRELFKEIQPPPT